MFYPASDFDAVLSLICREFGVSEEWLRTGSGEMFSPAPTDVLDQLAQKYKLSNAAYIMIEKFVNLNPDKQAGLIDFCRLEIKRRQSDCFFLIRIEQQYFP